jgi:putative transposase
MRNSPPPKSFTRRSVSHEASFEGRFGAAYFITICCERRGTNQLCKQTVADSLFRTAAQYDQQQEWHVVLMLLMPDHLHALISIGGDKSLSKLIGSFKRATSKFAGVKWQRNFFDHRLRSDESLEDKGAYIRDNPVRAGLVSCSTDWRYVLDRAKLDQIAVR